MQPPGERVPEIVGGDRDWERRSSQPAPDEFPHARIDLDHREPGDPGADAVPLGEQAEGDRGEVVVAEEEDLLAVERAGFVEREDAAHLRLDGAVRLVERDIRAGGPSGNERKPPHGGRELARHDDPRPHAGAATGVDEPAPCQALNASRPNGVRRTGRL